MGPANALTDFISSEQGRHLQISRYGGPNPNLLEHIKPKALLRAVDGVSKLALLVLLG